jgi:transcriptional regulator with XRE-family HTH domain
MIPKDAAKKPVDSPKIRSSTNAFLNRLLEAPDLEQFMKSNEDEMQIPSFCEYITQLCKLVGEVPERIIKRANIERSYGHQIFRGSRNPSRDTVLQLAFGFGIGVDKTQELLKYAGKNALYPRVKRDAALIYCLRNHFTIVETQRVLHEMGLPLLGAGKMK